MTELRAVENVTCLGCGCACDDIAVVVRDGRIAEARNACRLGVRWFGDGQLPSMILVDGAGVALPHAISSAAALLREAARPLVYLAPGISTESQGEGAAIADLLHARLDSVTSDTAAAFILAGQELGYAAATLGEIRNRADVVVFWGIDLERRYPRFASRYAPDPVGTHVPHGRRSRTVMAVDVGAAAATVDADHRIRIDPPSEIATLTALEAIVRAPADEASRYASLADSAWTIARGLAPALMVARYVGLVYDAERDDRANRSPQRFAALASLAQSLNDRTRCAAIALRGGGNRSGADSALVAQTGYPFAVDFSRGFPRYDPCHGSARSLLRTREVDAALVVGDLTASPDDIKREIAEVRAVVIGPRASDVALGARSVVIDTGADGIHDAGTGLRADDVPLPLRASVSGARATAAIVRAVAAALTSSP